MSLPYWSLPTLSLDLPWLGPVTLTVFGLTAAVGLWLGLRGSERWANARGIPLGVFVRVRLWTVLAGFAGAHWVSMLAYYPDRVLEAPWVLLDFTSGLSSTGGFLGGAIGFVIATRRVRELRPSLADAIAYGLLLGFTVGRLGCTLVHDHPGAVVAPGDLLAVGPWPDGQYRYDLGLIEFLGCVVLVVGVRWGLRPDRVAPGRLVWTLPLLYAVGRFPLDFLRAVDTRHFGLTFAQWACIAIAAWAVVWGRGFAAKRPETPVS